MNQPYFRAHRAGEQWRTSGSPACALGHRLPGNSQGGADGVYAAWDWDGHRLLVRNDRYGFFPLYYFHGPEGIGVSPSLLRLLAEGAPPQLDEDALAVFLRLGFFLGEDTPFASIRALPPAATLQWAEGRLSLTGQLVHSPPQSMHRGAAVDAYIALFSQAMRRRPSPEAVVLPLSGGRDSRHILLELCASGRKPAYCMTVRNFPPRADEDARVAADLARALDVPHRVLDRPVSRLQAERQKNLRTSLCADEHAQFLPLAAALQGREGAVYDGIGGDILSAGLMLDEREIEFAASGRLEEWSEAILDTRCNPLPAEAELSRLLPRPLYERLGRARARERIIAELRRHREAPNPGGQFYFWNRTRREIALAPYALLGQGTPVFSPYLDHDLYDFLASLPAADLLDCNLHTEAIARGYPKYAHIPYEQPYAQDWKGRGSRRFFRRWTAETMVALARHSSDLVRRSVLFSDLGARLLAGSGAIACVGPLAAYLLLLEEVSTLEGARAALESEADSEAPIG